MADVKLPITEQLRQLDDARKLVLRDVSYYPSITRGILPILASNQPVELRRWGTEFLAEAFSSPVLPRQEKETLGVELLETLKNMVEAQGQDLFVLRSAIQVVSSVYPLALRWIINNSWDTETWKRLQAVKSRILRIWDDAAPTIRLACIKFAQRVVLAQTTAVDMIQMRDGLEISLRTIPSGHTLLEPRNLEAEATGLLDRMLGVLQDNSSEALIVDGTLNTLSILIRTRPSTSSRILNSVLAFNPLKLANSPMTPKNKMYIKSMEKTTRMLLLHLFKRDPQNPLAPRIQQHVERLMRSKAEILDGIGQKRPLEPQPADVQGDVKRQKVDVVPAAIQVNPLAPGPNSLAALFTMTGNAGLQAYDATQIPAALAARISINTLLNVAPEALNAVVYKVRERLAQKHAAQPPVLNAETAPLGVDDDDDDYEPDYYQAEDTEQILNRLDSSIVPPGKQQKPVEDATLALGLWKLPPPPSLSPEMAAAAGQGTVMRVFDSIKTLQEPPVKPARAGLNRLAARKNDRDSWLTVIMRLATRASAGLEESEAVKPQENTDATALAVKSPNGTSATLGTTIRDLLYHYILEDFRKRIDVAVSWLCEEWYNDALQRKQSPPTFKTLLRYDTIAMRLVEGFFPYLNPQDKVLTRFLAEIPEVKPAILRKVKDLCSDPAMVQLSLTSLLYLVMLKPPAREVALDAVQDIWIECESRLSLLNINAVSSCVVAEAGVLMYNVADEDARPMAAKYLTKWRPGFVEAQTQAQSTGAGEAMKSPNAMAQVIAT